MTTYSDRPWVVLEHLPVHLLSIRGRLPSRGVRTSNTCRETHLELISRSSTTSTALSYLLVTCHGRN